MAEMRHRHTITFRLIREKLNEKMGLASSRKLKVERLETALALENKKLANEKVIGDLKVKDVISHVDSVTRTKDLVIQEW